MHLASNVVGGLRRDAPDPSLFFLLLVAFFVFQETATLHCEERRSRNYYRGSTYDLGKD